MNRLQQLETCGQAPWLDFLDRRLVRGGGLRRLIEQDGLKGVTSNPTIFAKGIGDTDQYDEALAAAGATAPASLDQVYEQLAIEDIRGAADTLHPVYEATQGADGYVSLEVSPFLASNTEGSIAEARRLWQAVGRPNVMIKVPGTPAGIPAVRQLTGEGINVNITLLFSGDVYEEVVEAYMGGLEDLHQRGGDLSRVASVASFFVSRIDTAVEQRLQVLPDSPGKAEAVASLNGKVAIANAKLVYQRSKRLHADERWLALRGKGARRQRLLWASTGTKNPAYPDTQYIDTLIGADTVSTMPMATLEAFRDHGKVVADAIEQDIEQAREVMARLEELGISLAMIAKYLVDDGVKQFMGSYDSLLKAVARKSRGRVYS
jgi:transaldolase/glucose-6-phosphate isomerase